MRIIIIIDEKTIVSMQIAWRADLTIIKLKHCDEVEILKYTELIWETEIQV